MLFTWIMKNKWLIAFIIMTIIAILLTVSSVSLSKQNEELKYQAVTSLNSEWYELYRLSSKIEKRLIDHNFQNANKYQLYVNSTVYHFALRDSFDELALNMRNLLIFGYDPLFTDLSSENGPLNKDEAITILTEMNQDLMQITKAVIDMDHLEKQYLLEPSSSVYTDVNTNLKHMSDKYMKLVDDYFRNNQQ